MKALFKFSNVYKQSRGGGAHLQKERGKNIIGENAEDRVHFLPNR